MTQYTPQQQQTAGSRARSMVNKAGLSLKARGINAGMGVIDAAMEFYNRRSNHPDESMLKSGIFAAGSFAAWTVMPGIMFGKTFGELGYEVGKAAMEFGATAPSARNARWNSGGQIGMGFVDSDKAYTARQRGLQAIENSRMNARSALGNEARSLHGR